jgi:hypothetical protein
MKRIVCIATIIAVLSGCHTAKKVERIEAAISKKDTSQTVIITPEKTIDSFSLVKNIINDISRHHINFSTFYGKIKIDYEGKDGGDQATASVRIKKDSLIWVSVTGALGIEGLRLLIDKDSVRLMNKLDKTVQYRSISYLQDLTQVPIDFFGLQDIIVGNPVFLDSNIVSFKANQNELLVLMVGKIFKNLITLQNKNFRVIHLKLDDTDPIRNRTCDITLDGYENVNNISFSTIRKITVAERSKLDINLQFKQYSFNQPQTFPFSVPKNYSKK